MDRGAWSIGSQPTQSIGSRSVGHDWSDWAYTHDCPLEAESSHHQSSLPPDSPRRWSLLPFTTAPHYNSSDSKTQKLTTTGMYVVLFSWDFSSGFSWYQHLFGNNDLSLACSQVNKTEVKQEFQTWIFFHWCLLYLLLGNWGDKKRHVSTQTWHMLTGLGKIIW